MILGVDQAYYEVLLAQQLVKVAQQTVAARQVVVDQISELTRNKLKSDVDLELCAGQFSRRKAHVVAVAGSPARRVRDTWPGSWQSAIHRVSTRHLLLPPEAPKDAESLIKQAFQSRPELASLQMQVEAAQKYVDAERDLKLLTVSLMAVGGALANIKPGSRYWISPLGTSRRRST